MSLCVILCVQIIVTEFRKHTTLVNRLQYLQSKLREATGAAGVAK